MVRCYFFSALNCLLLVYQLVREGHLSKKLLFLNHISITIQCYSHHELWPTWQTFLLQTFLSTYFFPAHFACRHSNNHSLKCHSRLLSNQWAYYYVSIIQSTAQPAAIRINVRNLLIVCTYCGELLKRPKLLTSRLSWLHQLRLTVQPIHVRTFHKLYYYPGGPVGILQHIYIKRH